MPRGLRGRFESLSCNAFFAKFFTAPVELDENVYYFLPEDITHLNTRS